MKVGMYLIWDKKNKFWEQDKIHFGIKSKSILGFKNQKNSDIWLNQKILDQNSKIFRKILFEILLVHFSPWIPQDKPATAHKNSVAWNFFVFSSFFFSFRISEKN